MTAASETTHVFYNSSIEPVGTSVPVHLVVTSPPYPMIEMWDECFSRQDGGIARLIEQSPVEAFDCMCGIINRVIAASCETLIDGGFLIVNVGDATRSVNGSFASYPASAWVTRFCVAELGMTCLPKIIWNKPTNKPNKFMGSGMLPAGAYVTHEHEDVLIFRKGGKRAFKTEGEKLRRAESAMFWEERNQWFSSIWSGLTGTPQAVSAEVRSRSGAYPFELAYRLVAMYSVRGETVLDPFAGLGTTNLAAAALERNSIGYEIAGDICDIAKQRLAESRQWINDYNTKRVKRHAAFVDDYLGRGKTAKHMNETIRLPVVTSQETKTFLRCITKVDATDADRTTITYENLL